MSENSTNGINIFKYNTSFYYQSTIIYLVVFVLYLIIRGEFVEDSFTLITRDPVLYFLALIVLISVAALVYNLFKDKHIEITEDTIRFIDRFKTREYNFDEIKQIKFSRQRRAINASGFKTVRIKTNTKKLPIMIRLSDYENQEELFKQIEQIKNRTENN